MKDILSTIQSWAEDDRPFVLARVVATWGSAPRGVGSAMAIASGGEFVGSVSGGCVEGAVIQEAEAVLDTGEPRLLEFGVDDERAWSVGLSCGGRIKVILEMFPSQWKDRAEREVAVGWLAMLERGEPGVVVSRLDAEDHGHCLFLSDGSAVGRLRTSADQTVAKALSALNLRRSELTQIDGNDVFVHYIRGDETLLIVGATDIAVHLVRLAKSLGFRTVVVDPRPVFADAARFDPGPDQLLAAWPEDAFSDVTVTRDTYAVLLSHNPRIDDPALQRLLESDCRYIGALGGRKTQEKRRDRMRKTGFLELDIARIKGPVGLDIGASSPPEIALSIIAEVVATRNLHEPVSP